MARVFEDEVVFDENGKVKGWIGGDDDHEWVGFALSSWTEAERAPLFPEGTRVRIRLEFERMN